MSGAREAGSRGAGARGAGPRSDEALRAVRKELKDLRRQLAERDASIAGLERDLKAARAAAVEAEAELAAASAPVPVPAAGRRSGPKRGKPRRLPALPDGVFDGTIEAHRSMLASAANLVLVDGYNVARTAWAGVSVAEERRRVVAVLEELQARSAGTVVVVFDGDHQVSSPVASRSVRVQYSRAGQTADEVICALVDAAPRSQPVVVVSSDRMIHGHARSRGAISLRSDELLAALGR